MIKIVRNKSLFLVLALLVIAIQCVVESQALAESILAWGNNSYGQCNIPSPNSDFIAIAAGGYHSLGLKQDGSIIACGENWAGQCDVPSPNAGFAAVSAGIYHSLGLKTDGSIVAWGWNVNGQCNIPSPNAGFVAVAAGWYHSLGLKEDDSIVACGDNGAGQRNIPLPNAGFNAVSAGGYHSVGLKEDGSIVAWGWNYYGQCNIPSPNADFIAVSAGANHNLGLKADGSIVAWGDNSYDQCNIPSPNSGFIAVAAGGYHSLCLKADGSIVSWGRNNYGQCDIPSPNAGFVAIAAGLYHSLALRVDNATPVANAGQDQNVPILFEVTLDGSGSSDPDGDYPLSYSWQIVERPQGSAAQLSNPETMNPSFIPDIVGNYTIELVVTDSRGLESEPDYVVITTITIEQAVDEKLAETIVQIDELDPDNLNNPNSANALFNKINATLAMIDEGLYQDALNKLRNDILKKTDGCTNTGQPDKNDWILTCEDQQKVYPLVLRAIELLERLLQ